MTDGPLVSLLLPNRNNERVLELVLDRLAANTTYPRVEVVAVDDGSTDGSLEILRAWRDSDRFPSFRLIEREHAGAIDALNAGLDAAKGEVVVQLDADASVESRGWIEKMLALLTCDERVGVVTARVVFDYGAIHACGINIVSPRGMHDRPSRITERVGRRAWHFRVERFPEGSRDEERAVAEVDSGIGCCMMYRREDALAAGGYDREFSPVWFDDLDLCMSIRRRGKKVFCLPEVRVVHRVRARDGKPVSLSGVRERGVATLRWVALKAGSVWPAGRAAVARALGLNSPRPEHRERLRHHYDYWQSKWGWNPLNPDMAEVQRRYGASEVAWSLTPERRTAGEEIAAAFERGREHPGTGSPPRKAEPR